MLLNTFFTLLKVKIPYAMHEMLANSTPFEILVNESLQFAWRNFVSGEYIEANIQ